jgi:hypothetical protein
MTIPYRGATRGGTYFITASAYEKLALFQSDRMGQLLMDVLFHYQRQSRYHLHEFVVMPDHFHLLLTPILPVTIASKEVFPTGQGRSLGSRERSGRPAFMIDEFGMLKSMPGSGTTST